jgi:integrase
MGHRDTEMIIKHYGRWIPDKSVVAGYKPVNNWEILLSSPNEKIRTL